MITSCKCLNNHNSVKKIYLNFKRKSTCFISSHSLFLLVIIHFLPGASFEISKRFQMSKNKNMCDKATLFYHKISKTHHFFFLLPIWTCCIFTGQLPDLSKSCMVSGKTFITFIFWFFCGFWSTNKKLHGLFR